MVGRGTHRGSSDNVVHTHASIVVCIEGTSELWMRTAWQLTPGDVVLIPDGEPHHRLSEHPNTWIGIGVCASCLPIERWGAALRELFDRVRTGGCPVSRPVQFERMVQDIEMLDDELNAPGPSTDMVIDGLFALLTAGLLRASPVAPAPSQSQTPLVAQTLAWIRAHALEPISLSDVAAAVGRAPTHLAARVKSETGHPVGHWILSIRMAVARDLLLRTDDNIDVLAERVGYASASHFHRTFRRIHGVAPDGWRRAHRRRSSTHASIVV